VTAAAPGEVTRTAYGVAEAKAALTGPVALVVAGSGRVPEAGPGTVTAAPAGAVFPVETVSEEPGETADANLGVASRVVSVGRGFKAEADLALADALAAALGAAVACSRPVAEGLGWLPRDRYVGISGRVIEPDLYIAAGISGQMQHMIAVRGAKKIVAINSDANAPIFQQADVGVVGDLYAVLPALTAALS
jgi:electron transfer flavoprotein alpha subunit